MAVAITVTEQGDWPSRVLVSVTGLTLGDSIQLYRLVGGERTLVRAGEDDAVADTSFLRTDAELPFGVPVSYLALVNDTDEYSTSATTYTLDGGKVALTDAINGNSAEVVIMAWPDQSYQPQSSVFRVGGRNVVVSGDMGMFEGELELYLENTSSIENLTSLVRNATEGTVQIRQAGGYDDVDSYVAVLGMTKKRFSQDGSDQRRLISLNVAEVEGWAPGLEAQGETLQDIADAYTAETILNPNPYFETNATGWLAVGGSVARSTAQAHEGTASLLLTPDGVTANVEARTDQLPASASHLYRVSAWLRCTSSRNVNLNINWYTAGGSFISVSSKTTALTANTWTFVTEEFTAPATTGGARLCAQMAGTPAVSVLVYVDEATIKSVVSLVDLSDDYATLLAIAQGEFA